MSGADRRNQHSVSVWAAAFLLIHSAHKLKPTEVFHAIT